MTPSVAHAPAVDRRGVNTRPRADTTRNAIRARTSRAWPRDSTSRRSRSSSSIKACSAGHSGDAIQQVKSPRISSRRCVLRSLPICAARKSPRPRRVSAHSSSARTCGWREELIPDRDAVDAQCAPMLMSALAPWSVPAPLPPSRREAAAPGSPVARRVLMARLAPCLRAVRGWVAARLGARCAGLRRFRRGATSMLPRQSAWLRSGMRRLRRRSGHRRCRAGSDSRRTVPRRAVWCEWRWMNTRSVHRWCFRSSDRSA